MTSLTTSSCSSLSCCGDGSERDREADLDEGYLSDRNFVFDQHKQSRGHWTDSEPESDGQGTLGRENEQYQHQHQHQHQHQQERRTSEQLYTSACKRLGIPPSSHVLSRLSSDRLSLRHALLNPASAMALSAGLSANRCIRSLNLGSNLLGDDNARPLLEALRGNSSLTKLDLSRNLLSDSFGALLAQNVSSPLCTLQELVLAENFLSDAFTGALNKGFLRLVALKSRIPLRALDVCNNKISDRDKGALASILCSCSSLVNLNLSWNALRNNERSKQQKGHAGMHRRFPFISAALSCPGRLVSLELSFNGLADGFGVVIGTMLGKNVSLLLLDLSRNRLEKSAALSIASGLESNRSLTTLKLGWNNFGRDGTLRVIKAIGDNQGPLQVVRLENTTDAGMESEAAREAEEAVASRPRWIETNRAKAVDNIPKRKVVCEFPDRARTRGNSRGGPVSWMNEQAPQVDANTTYKTRTEKEREMEVENLAMVVEALKARVSAMKPGSGSHANAGARTAAPVARSGDGRSVTKKSVSPASVRTSSLASSEAGRGRGRISGRAGDGLDEKKDRVPSPGPAKEAVAVPVLSVRLKLIAREKTRLEAERLAAEEALAAAEKAEKRRSGMLSYLKPLNKTVKEKTLAEPPPKSVMLAKARAGTYHTAALRARAERKRSPRRGRSVARRAAARAVAGGKDRLQAHGHTRTTRSGRARGPARRSSRHGKQGRGFKSSSMGAWACVKGTGQTVWQGSGQSKREVSACSRQRGRGGRSGTTRKSRSRSPISRSVDATTSRGGRRKIS